ncbi:MAG TPA: glycosyltransferase [Candidatus Dormibacteraeota bacterium]|nr:glycosyltransferase [Candidatus Dormibacteraeota bacterium]
MTIVVPVYNEGENVVPTLRGVVEKTRTRPLEVLVVYDFDEDTTVPVVERLRAELPELHLHRNNVGRGVVNALKSGLAAARAPYVLVTMGDGSDDPGDIDAMYELAHSGADVVAGSRYVRGGHQVGGPVLKRTMSRVAGLSLHWFGGLPVHDATSNFRMYSKRLLQRVTIESDGGFELGLELTVKAYAMGMQVAEVPTTWRDRTEGQSRFQLWKWLPRYLRWYRVGIAARRPRRT